MKKNIFLIIALLVLSTFVYAAPQVGNVDITTSAPIYTSDNIVCSFDLNSTTGEAVWGNVTWYKNSNAQDTSVKGPITSLSTLTDTLLSTETTKGESWYCSAKAYNSTSVTGSINSLTVVIANTNVSLSDIPAQNIVENSGKNSVDISSYAVDPDTADTISFSAVGDSNVICDISGDMLEIEPIADFNGVGYCDVTAYDETHITAPKTVTVNVAAESVSLSIPSMPTPTVVIGGSSVTKTFSLTNNGNVDLTVTFAHSDLSQIGNSSNKISSSYVQVNSGNSLNIAAGESKSVNIRVTPSSWDEGSYTGNITFNYDTESEARDLTVTVKTGDAYLSVPSTVYLGAGSNQDRNESVSGSFTIENTGISGDNTLTGMKISTTASSSKYKVNFSLTENSGFSSELTGFTLNTGQSQTIYYRGFIPEDMDSGSTDIGDINVESDQIDKTISNFLVNSPSMLTIDDINAEVDGDDDNSISVSGGDEIGPEASPGSVVKIEVKLENEFSSASDIKIEDVRITVTIEGIEGEDDDDLEEETSSFDIREDSKSDTKTLTFNLPYDIDEGTYDVRIEAEGTDEEYNSEHSVSTTVLLVVEKEDHLIKIMKARLGSDEVVCDDYTTFDLQIQNLGNDDEDEVIVTVKNPTLGLTYTSNEFELTEDTSDDDSEFNKIFTVDLRELTLKSGIYGIEVNTFYSGDIISDTETVYLTVTGCEGEVDEKEETIDETVVLEQESEGLEGEGGVLAQEVYETDTIEKGFTGGAGYIVLLVLGNLIIIGGAIFLVFKFLLSPKA